MTTVNFSDVASHFVDSHHGIYSAQIFAEYLNPKFQQGKVLGINSEDWNVLLSGPENEDYIEVWADSLNNITIIAENGERWNVYENEGIYVYPESANIDWDEMA